MSIQVQFCGAAQTVTGSKHLLTINDKKILVDCGIFQGPEEVRKRNHEDWPFSPHELDAVVVTHAHMDHIGMIPKLVKDGYRGPIYATKPTIGLAKVSLPDSGRLQEEEANYRRRKGLDNAVPIYTEKDAYACLGRFQPVHFYEFHDLPGGSTWRYLPAGHILGSAYAEIYFPNGERILMGGDLGRFNTPIIKDPALVDFAEYLVVESTYGDRLHSEENPEDIIEGVLKQAIENGSCVLVPSFAIGRTQELLYYIRKLEDEGRIGRIPVFVDSPMAISASQLYRDCDEDHDKEMREMSELHENPIEPDHLTYVRDREQSKMLNSHKGPLVIIAGSGMANGGRIIHHLMNRLGDSSTIVLFTGYQAEGTLGRKLIEKEPVVEILGREVNVKCSVQKINSMSAHADQGEIMAWLGNFRTPPKKTFIVHGEKNAQLTLQEKIHEELGWETHIPHHLETVDLD